MTHFCVIFEVCVWIIVRLEDPNMAHYKISNRVSHLLIFYLLVFDTIHDAMCLNKMSRTSSRNIGPQHHKYSSIFHCAHGELFIPVFTKLILSVCKKQKQKIVSSDHRSQSHLKLQLCLITEYAGVCFWMSRISFLENLPNNMWWCMCCLTIFINVFWPRDSTISCNSPAVVLWESFATQTRLLTVH